jgi:DNA-nicking Smr family endonuclease
VKRPLKPEELKVWAVVAATVHPLPGKAAPTPTREAGPSATGPALPPLKMTPAKPPPSRPGPPRAALETIEPRRRHRIAKAREEIGARLDLHGLDQVRAKAVLEGFVRRAWDDGYRAVLVITGKGVQGDGILKRRVPEWLGAPHLAAIVAGISDAARHHGGEGALYVALKRKIK